MLIFEFNMWMYGKIKNMYTSIHISEAYLLLTYGKQFITEIFEGPWYNTQITHIKHTLLNSLGLGKSSRYTKQWVCVLSTSFAHFQKKIKPLNAPCTSGIKCVYFISNYFNRNPCPFS